jgi:hypothetical protein
MPLCYTLAFEMWCATWNTERPVVFETLVGRVTAKDINISIYIYIHIYVYMYIYEAKNF